MRRLRSLLSGPRQENPTRPDGVEILGVGQYGPRVHVETAIPLVDFEYEPDGFRVLRVMGEPTSATWAMCDTCSISLDRRSGDERSARELADRLRDMLEPGSSHLITRISQA